MSSKFPFIRCHNTIIPMSAIEQISSKRIKALFDQEECEIKLHYTVRKENSLEEAYEHRAVTIAICNIEDLEIYLDLILDVLCVGCGTDIVKFIRGSVFQNRVKYNKQELERENRRWDFYAKSQPDKMGPFDLDKWNEQLEMNAKFEEQEKKNRENK